VPRGAALLFADFKEREMDIAEICVRPKSEHVEETNSSVARSRSLLGKSALLYFYNHVTSQHAIESTGCLFVFRSPQRRWARMPPRVTRGVFPTLRSSQAGWQVHSTLPAQNRVGREGTHPTLGGHARCQTSPSLQGPASLIGVQEPPSSCPEIPAVPGARPGRREGNGELCGGEGRAGVVIWLRRDKYAPNSVSASLAAKILVSLCISHASTAKPQCPPRSETPGPQAAAWDITAAPCPAGAGAEG